MFKVTLIRKGEFRLKNNNFSIKFKSILFLQNLNFLYK